MNNKDSGFEVYNYERKREKIKLYNSILAVMKLPVTIQELVILHKQSRKPSFYSNIITNLIRTGHIIKTGKGSGNKIIYQATKFHYHEELGRRPNVKHNKVIDEVPNGAVRYSLDDKGSTYATNYAATQRDRDSTRKTGKVYIASTFNMV